MEQSTPRTIAATSWSLLLICLVAVVFAGVHQACAQPDSIGMLHIPTEFHDISQPTYCLYRWLYYDKQLHARMVEEKLLQVSSA
jgi:hypothetical protein